MCIGSTFTQLFNPKRGDVVYGRGDQRERYHGQLPPSTQSLLDACYWMVDHYNDAVQVSIAHYPDRSLPGSPIGADPSSIPSPQDRAYLAALKQSRFTPDGIQ